MKNKTSEQVQKINLSKSQPCKYASQTGEVSSRTVTNGDQIVIRQQVKESKSVCPSSHSPLNLAYIPLGNCQTSHFNNGVCYVNNDNGNNPNSSLLVAHSQQIQAMELQFQSVVHSYQVKLKNMNQQYRRSKQEMETKIRQLFKQKNYWHNMATNLSEHSKTSQRINQISVNNNLTQNMQKPAIQNEKKLQRYPSIQQSPSPTLQQQHFVQYAPVSSSNSDRILLSQFAKLRKKIEEIQKQNTKINQQKLSLTNQVQKLNIQSNGLKAKVLEYLKLIYKFQQQKQTMQQMPMQNGYGQMKQKNSPSLAPKRHIGSPPRRSSSHRQIQFIPVINMSIHQFQSIKLNSEKCKQLVNSLNEDIITSNLKRLNQKYEKGLGYAGVSRGSTYVASQNTPLSSAMSSELVARNRTSSHITQFPNQ